MQLGEENDEVQCKKASPAGAGGGPTWCKSDLISVDFKFHHGKDKERNTSQI